MCVVWLQCARDLTVGTENDTLPEAIGDPSLATPAHARIQPTPRSAAADPLDRAYAGVTKPGSPEGKTIAQLRGSHGRVGGERIRAVRKPCSSGQAVQVAIPSRRSFSANPQLAGRYISGISHGCFAATHAVSIGLEHVAEL